MALNVLAFVMLAVGLFLILGINIKALKFETEQQAEKFPTMRQIVEKSTHTGGNVITHLFSQLYESLQLSGIETSYARYLHICIILAIICGVAALFLGNPFLAPVAALIGLVSPILYINIIGIGHIKQQNKEIQTSISILTPSFKRSGNIFRAIDENIDHVHEPVKSVLLRFQAQNRFITTNVEKSLDDMKLQIKSDIWREWCETIILCLHDHSKVNTLNSIVDKMRNTDVVQIGLDEKLYEPIQEFAIMLIISLSIFPMMYILNIDLFNILTQTIQGKISTAVTFIAMLYGLYKLKKALRPLK